MTDMTLDDWDNLTYFKRTEFNCKHSGENKMQLEFMEKLSELRRACGFPFVITSGYRTATHPVEALKQIKNGTHVRGIACDIRVENGVQRRKVVEEAIRLGFRGIGIAKYFVHVDTRPEDELAVMWSY